MNQPGVSRRSFLQYVGFGALSAVAASYLGPLERAAAATLDQGWVSAAGVPAFAPVTYPLPLPTDPIDGLKAAQRLATYRVIDDLQVPKGWRYDVVAAWGDRFGPVRFGFAADYTGLTPIAGSDDEFWLLVNHEYISGRPWLQGAKEILGVELVDAQGRIAGRKLLGLSADLVNDRKSVDPALQQAIQKICEAAMSDLGVSVLRVRREPDGAIRVVTDAPDHFRIHGFGAANFDPAHMSFTGPAAPLLGQPRGTFANCSGATTPWGTFLTCEENFQDQVPEFITPSGERLQGDGKLFAAQGDPHPTQLPFEFEGLGTGLAEPLDGRQYGWVVEIDPVRRTMKKHTALGRFRHENVAIRAEAGKPLVAYMGDDRRGGHVWKFVSRDRVTDPTSPDTSRLLEHGTLYAAHWTDDFTGQWIPLTPQTTLQMPNPDACTTAHLWLPLRPRGGHTAIGSGTTAEKSLKGWLMLLDLYTGGKPFESLTLGDLCDPTLNPAAKQAVIVMDAYVMANAAGATPTARPEDIEIHPRDQSAYIAFTDSTGSGDGSPDARIFPDSRGDSSRQYGAIYRIAEGGNDPAAGAFTWGKFVAAGEVAEQGSGFACADNLAFDPQANLWMVCDIATPRHNVSVTRSAEDKTHPGGSAFVGIFGNNAMFCIPTTGEHAGKPFCFAIGPMECELTGPTFTEDGRTLLVSIQHPGELHGTHQHPAVQQPTEETRKMRLVDADGASFDQTRVVPLGSNFPTNKPGATPRPCVVAIRRV